MRRSASSFRWGVGIEGSSIPHLGISQYSWTGHDRRWASDLRTIRLALGPCWLRYPVPWERAQPSRASFEWGAVEERLEFAHGLGFRLVPGLIHFGTPAWLPGAFGDPEFPEAAEEYAARFAERFGELTAAYVPINEPLITALFAGDLGLWPPHRRGWRGYMPVLSRLAQALVRCTRALRGCDPAADVVYVEAVEDYRTTDARLEEDVARRNHRRFLLLDLVTGRVDEHHPLYGWLLAYGFPECDLAWLSRNAQAPSRLGLDYYAHSETELSSGPGGVRHVPVARPRGFAEVARQYHARYGWPLLVTETNAGGSEAQKRAWLAKMVRQIARARGRGVPVEGLFWWPAFDHVDWDGALLHQSGNLHPVGLWRLAGRDQESYELRETPLVRAYAELVRSGDAAVGLVAGGQRASGGATLSLDSGATHVSPARQQDFPIVVHCHLRWSFVWQRPQQTHSRLAPRHPILFIEEPLWEQRAGAGRLELSEPWPGLTLAQPVLTGRLQEDTAAAERAVLALLRESLEGPLGRRFARAVHWLYTPQMEGQLAAFADVGAVVYDCMDELSQFAYAPAELQARERRLLARADVVFTGGHELYRKKSRLHPNVHAFGCGVDYRHFHAAANGAVPPPDLAFIPAPRLGYIGVIDERLDYELLRQLARENPDLSLVLVGPVAKVDPTRLPRPRNAFYLGARPYASLPSYLAGFDVCLMPFALNEATEFINPTKTLEYLATGKPVVSTPVRDVVRGFGDVVHVAPREEFVSRVRQVLAGERLDPRRGLRAARRASWERVVNGMESLAEQALRTCRAPSAVGRAAAPSLRVQGASA